MPDPDLNPFEPPAIEEDTRLRISKERPATDFGKSSIYIHLATVVLGYLVVSNEQLFFSAIPQFLIVIPLVATFYICPIAAIVVVRSEVDEHLLMRLTLILLEFVLSAVQLFVWLPSVQ